MGTWGVGIFQDDTTADVRSTYRELIEDGVPDDEATRRVIGEFRPTAETEHLLWLALAAAQSEVGRLDDTVRDRAVAAIDSGTDLRLWDTTGEERRRSAALEKLRSRLVGPQPKRKRLRGPAWVYDSGLVAGDVLTHTATNGAISLFSVLVVDRHRTGDFPCFVQLNWTGRRIPAMWRIGRMSARGQTPQPITGRPRGPKTYVAHRSFPEEPDFAECGFAVVGRGRLRAERPHQIGETSATWRTLSRLLSEDQPR